MHETSARAFCTRKTQRDRGEREVGGGIGMGNTCKSMADSCQCMTKTTTYCKVISLQLTKMGKKKKRKDEPGPRPRKEMGFSHEHNVIGDKSTDKRLVRIFLFFITSTSSPVQEGT